MAVRSCIGQVDVHQANGHHSNHKLDEQAKPSQRTKLIVPTYHELCRRYTSYSRAACLPSTKYDNDHRYDGTLASNSHSKPMMDLFSIDALLEAGLTADIEPVGDEGDYSDEESMFLITDTIPTTGTV